MAAEVGKLNLLLAADASQFLSATNAARAAASKLQADTSHSFGGVASAAASMGGGIASAAGSIVKGLGAIGLAAQGVGALKDMAIGAGQALGIGLNVELENTRAQLVAFTKSGEQADKILADIRKEASTTPFAFKEMAAATASLLPASKQSGVALMDLVKQAEILAASNPAQGLEGAAFALKEALGGDFVSIVERFNLPRQTLNKLKAEGVPAMKAIQIAMKEMGLDADLVSGLANTASGRWSTLMDTFDTLRVTLSKPLFEMLSKSLGDLQPLLDASMPAMEAFAAQVGQGMVDAVNKAVEVFKNLKAMFNDLLIPVFERFKEGNFQAAFDLIKTAVLELADTIRPALDQFIARLGDMLPPILEKVGEWGRALVEWVGPQIMPLLNKMQDLREQLFSWVIEQIPGWIETLGQWAVQLVEWVAPMIAPAIKELGKFLTRILDWILEMAPTVFQKFIGEWVPAALGWIARAAVELGKHLPDILGALAEWILVEGVPRVITLFFKLGGALIEGVIQGAKSMYGGLFSAMQEMAGQALQAAKDKLGIKSPSKEFMKVGQQIAEGMAMGIDGGTPRVRHAMANMAQLQRARQIDRVFDAFGFRGTYHGRNTVRSTMPELDRLTMLNESRATQAEGHPMGPLIMQLIQLLNGGLTVEMDGNLVGRVVSRSIDQRADVRSRMVGAGGLR